MDGFNLATDTLTPCVISLPSIRVGHPLDNGYAERTQNMLRYHYAISQHIFFE